MSLLVQNMMGFVKTAREIKDSEYSGAYLEDNVWKPIFSVENLGIFITDGLQQVRLIPKHKEGKEKQKEEKQEEQQGKKEGKEEEELLIVRFSAVMYDRKKKSWTLSYVSGPIKDVGEIESKIKLWDGEQWHDCEILNFTDSRLVPLKSSIEIQIKKKKETEKKIDQAMFHIEFSSNQIATCDWSMPSMKNSRWLINEVLAPVAATSTVAVITSLLFPNKVKDVKSALTWSIPGWLLLDGTELFHQFMQGTSGKLCPVTVKVRDPSFWIKAIATGMGPLLIPSSP